MSKIEQNREKKRQSILLAAQDAFLSEGYVSANMDSIAKQAKVTKQTVYRYYPSKVDLFKATLRSMGTRGGFDFLQHLQQDDSEKALQQFAVDFIRAHLSDNHLATFRLLLAEGEKAPEVMQSFFAVGPDETEQALITFFHDRLNIHEPEMIVQMWTSMLLAFRAQVLMGRDKPSSDELEKYACKAVVFLLAAAGAL